MSGGLRGRARDLAHAAGLLALRQRLQNPETLTVTMFHRVVEPGTATARTADPVYTLSAPLFAKCLDFFARHYAVVDLAAVRASLEDGPPLPKRALLLTFDDGWRDNLDVAAPLLRRAGLPAVLFAATDAVADAGGWWWQEMLLRALRTGARSFEQLWAALPGAGPPPAATVPELALLLAYGALDDAARARILGPLAAGTEAEGRHMLDRAELARLGGEGFAIGAHGAAHLPMSLMADPGEDLRRARQGIAALLGAAGAQSTLSFPHGRYDAAVLRDAASAGFDLLFTSDTIQNAAPGGRPGRLLGRISVEASGIADAAGRLVPSRLATWMFHRPVRRLKAPA